MELILRGHFEILKFVLSAALGLTVGVLTGVGGLHDLSDADVIVSDVQECVDMILPQQSIPREKPIVYQVMSMCCVLKGVTKINRTTYPYCRARRILLNRCSYETFFYFQILLKFIIRSVFMDSSKHLETFC